MSASQTHLQIEVVAGVDRGSRLWFPAPGTIILGRKGTPDLRLRRLTDPSVLERHLLVTVTEDEEVLLDQLGPSDSATIGGRVFRQARVSNGGLVRVGSAELRLTVLRRGLVTGGVPRAHLSEFEIVEEVGQGAFSRVYEAVERRTGRHVALKRLHLSDEPEREKLVSAFLREVELAASLSHPGIARVLYAGRKGDDLFLVMEFVDGPDLDACVRIEGPLPEDVVHRLATGILEALHHAHAKEVIHRDVKPSNVMLRGTGRDMEAVLVDFGLAIDAGRNATWGLTRSGEFRGTPDFLAPECLEDARAHSVRADLFGVAATLYFALSAHPCRTPTPGPSDGPFPFENLDIRPLAELRPGLEPRLRCTLERALAPDPARRWASADEMLRALQGTLDGSPPGGEEVAAGGHP